MLSFQFWINQKWPVCCFSRTESLTSDGFENGIRKGCGYPVVQFKEIDRNGQSLRLLKIIQPYAVQISPTVAFDVASCEGFDDPAAELEEFSGRCDPYFWIRFEDWHHDFTEGNTHNTSFQTKESRIDLSILIGLILCLSQYIPVLFSPKPGNRKACRAFSKARNLQILTSCCARPHLGVRLSL